MKTILLAGFLAFATLTASASGTHSSKKVSYTTNQNFQRQFGAVENVSWSEAAGDMMRATFTSGDETVSAFFNSDGEFVASCLNLQINDLPSKLKASVKEASKDATISEIIEVQSDSERAYYVKLQTATGEKIMKGYSNGYLRETKL